MPIPVAPRPAESLLTARAMDFLAAGPADVVSLIGHICQLPHPPRMVAEHMATALFQGRLEFQRDPDGRWRLVAEGDSFVGKATEVGASFAAPLGGRVSESRDLLHALNYVVVDVETTGGRVRGGDRITEIAIVEIRDGQIAGTYETLVNPERPIPSFITALTNISWAMVKHSPPFASISDKVVDALSGRIFVAHNAAFDWRFVSHEVERSTGNRLTGRRLCTVRLARKLLPQLRRRSLDHVAHYYGVDIGARHRAGGDAVATAHVLLRLLEDARHRGCETWQDLEYLLGGSAPSSRRRHKRRGLSGLPRPVDRDTTA